MDSKKYFNKRDKKKALKDKKAEAQAKQEENSDEEVSAHEDSEGSNEDV